MSEYGKLHRQSLHQGEDDYFSFNPEVAGMAAEDDKVIINPYSTLSDAEKRAVYRNESARIHMRNNGTPSFNMTESQKRFLDGNTYKNASDDERRATIIARIISGDSSAQDYTDEQKQIADSIGAKVDAMEYSDAFKEQTK